MHSNQHYAQTGTIEPKRWRVELLTEIAEERARQVEDDYRRAFDTHELDEVVQTARRPRLAPGLALLVLVLAICTTNLLSPQSLSGGSALSSASSEWPTP